MPTSSPTGAPPQAADDRPSSTASAPDFDSTYFRRALSQFATGVTVITSHSGLAGSGGPAFVGVAASSFNSVSLDPPLVLWSLATKANSLPVFRDGSHYVINVLSAHQVDLCKRFSTLHGDRFAGLEYQLSAHGLPILHEALAWFECHNRSRYDEGDHVIFVGEVERCGIHDAAGAPLIFQAGQFGTLQPLASQ